MYAETMLLIDNNQAEVFKFDFVLEEGVSPDNNVNITFR